MGRVWTLEVHLTGKDGRGGGVAELGSEKGGDSD